MKLPRVVRHFFKGKFLLPDLHRDTPRTFAAKKVRAVAKVTPLSLVHPATANVLLVLGTQNEFKCFLDNWLIWSGVSALTLYVLSVLANYILWWIINSDPNQVDRIVLVVQEAISLLCAAIEVIALSACSLILYPVLVKGKTHFENCKHSTVYFCAIFFTMMWILILLSCVSLTAITSARCLGIGHKLKNEKQDVERGKHDNKSKQRPLTWGEIEERFYSGVASNEGLPTEYDPIRLSKYHKVGTSSDEDRRRKDLSGSMGSSQSTATYRTTRERTSNRKSRSYKSKSTNYSTEKHSSRSRSNSSTSSVSEKSRKRSFNSDSRV